MTGVDASARDVADGRAVPANNCIVMSVTKSKTRHGPFTLMVDSKQFVGTIYPFRRARTSCPAFRSSKAADYTPTTSRRHIS
jgi:hypothetical protein